MDTFVNVGTYASHIEAELAQATLAAAGIDSILRHDDAGGMIAALDQKLGIRVAVEADKAEEARAVLTGTAEELLGS
jgi:hypothetical protein